MTLSMFLATSACLCLLGFWLSNVPEVWAAGIEREMERGATLDQARISLGWNRLGCIVMAFLNAAMAAAS